MENVPLTTRKEDRSYIWQRVGNIHHPNSYEKKIDLESSIDNTLFQDLVIAPSGIYFADLESLEDVRTPAHDLHAFHRHYMRSVLCSYTKIILALRLGDHFGSLDRRGYWRNDIGSFKKRTAKGILEELGTQLKKGDLVSLDVKKECVDLNVNYPHAGRRETFRFSLEDYLPLPKRLLAKGLLLAKNS